jgi:G:T-mismatch repair DNA endonuclease (very short patch repair protein)
MREKQIETRLRKEVNQIGGLALKFTSPGTAGVPDRIVLLPKGRVVFVELKAPGGKLRPLQLKRKKQLENLGFKVYVIDSYKKVDEFIREVVE